MTVDPETLARALLPLPAFGRVLAFSRAGGTLHRPDPLAMYWDEINWIAHHGHITGSGMTCRAAIDDWLAQAAAGIAIRATDGRLDCPYNGQAPLPPIPPSTRPETGP